MSSDIKIKQCGRIYKYITDAVTANYGRHTRPWKYDATRAAIVKAKVIEAEADSEYPAELHEALADIVLEWCWDGYPDTGKKDIYNIFLQLWKFHKKWMIAGEAYTASQISSQMNKEATDEIARLCEESSFPESKIRKDRIESLYTEVMVHVMETAKEEETVEGAIND